MDPITYGGHSFGAYCLAVAGEPVTLLANAFLMDDGTVEVTRLDAPSVFCCKLAADG